MKTNKILAIVTLWSAMFAATLFTSSCVKEDTPPTESVESVVMAINIASKSGSEAEAAELAINSFRIYAFVDGQFAGHYFYSGEAASSIACLFDIKLFSTTTQQVDFYAVANEASFLRYSNTTSLNASTTEAELKSLYFSSFDATQGLPMFYSGESVALDVVANSAALPENVVNADEHLNHTLLAQSVSLELMRPMAKIDMFATRMPNVTTNVKVSAINLAKEGIRVRNYLMPQSDATLQALLPYEQDYQLPLANDAGVDLTTNLPESYLTADAATQRSIRITESNHTHLLASAFYAFENPYGSDNPLTPEPNGKGHRLSIDYSYGSTSKTAVVNMPPVKRNTYYPIYCVFNTEGVLMVDYIVADWDEAEDNWTGGLDFSYPTYSNPIRPADLSISHPYAKPTMTYDNIDPEAGAWVGKFQMLAPVEQSWTVTLENASLADYDIRIYDPSGNALMVGGDYTPTVKVVDGLDSDDWYTIKIVPLNDSGKGNDVKLHIIYAPSWTTQNEMLLINGEDNATVYTDSGNDAETIIISHI